MSIENTISIFNAATVEALSTEELTLESMADVQPAQYTALVEWAYANLLGLEDVSEARIKFWVDYLSGDLQRGALATEDFAAEFLNLADTDQGQLSDEDYASNQAAIAAGTEAAGQEGATLASIAAAAVASRAPVEEPEQPTVPGEAIMLTPDADIREGTENDDTFVAPISTVNFANGNTLNSGDRLDGNGGNNTLDAELINDGFFQSGLGAVRPTTENIQNVIVNAIETSSASTVTLNAANMYDLENVWSKDSNANLVIQDITTKTSEGGVRNTEELTFRMDHTSNANTGTSNQSDMTVYFDENYLLAGRIEDSSRIQYEVMNQDAWDLINLDGRDDVELLDGVVFQRLDFELNGERVELTPLLGEGDSTSDGLTIRTHQDLVDAINEALVELGLDGTVTAVLGQDFTERSGIDGTQGRTAPSVVLEATPGNELNANENFAFLAPVDDPSAAIEGLRNSNRYDRAEEAIIDGQDELITTNLELHKAGRGDNGGDFHVGGKAGGSIAVFNVDVLGADEKPSDIGFISTGQNQGGMEQVNIATHADFVGGESYASLTIRDGFGNGAGNQQGDVNDAGLLVGGLLNVDANDFLGDLSVGTEQAIVNVADFSATGGGDVVYNADYFTTANHTITTGTGDDVVNVQLSGISNSLSSVTSADIVSNGGDNVITLGSFDEVVNTATVETGAGADIITGGEVSIEASAGAGNDVVYVDNTGAKGKGQILTDDILEQTDGNGFASYSFLYGRTVTVTVDGDQGINNAIAQAFESGFEGTAVVSASEGNSRLTTKQDLNNAVVEAVENSEVLSALVEVSITSKGDLFFTSKIDGDNISVEIGVGESDWSTNDFNTLRDEYRAAIGDSERTISDSYGDVTTNGQVLLDGTDSVAVNNNTVTLGAGVDTVVLSTQAEASDTIVIDQAFGTSHVVNFTLGQDNLDFSAFLNSQRSSSTSEASRSPIPVSFGETDNQLSANEVNIKTFAGNDDVESFADLNASNLLDVFNYSTQTYTNTSSNINLVDGNGNAIVMVQNDENAGEYKVFHVTFNGTDADFELSASNIQELGTLDFGADIFDSVEGPGVPPTDPVDPEVIVMEPGLTYDADGGDFTFQFGAQPMQAAIDNFAAGDVLQFSAEAVDAAGGVTVDFFQGNLDVYTEDFQLLAILNDVPAELAFEGVTLEDTVAVFGADWLQDEDGNSLIEMPEVDTNPVVTNNSVFDAAGDDFTFDVTANKTLSFELQNFSAGDQIDLSDDALASGLNASVANVDGDNFQLFLNDDDFEFVYNISFTSADLGGVALDEADVQGSLDAAWGDWLV